ncbi:alpha-E domain-containing protein [Phaeobacter sp. QD34_3]|uniref:alpha-E domain-containing protein n=1 Tax=unclassified Phaeobacter TaxID=2621772 RepID=UPI00237F2F5C|nr:MULTISPECIES: alpha-E domain-containing protein [unclassified Phaeobacter]MDE4131481.1 alpha-E domain-containing protein [Phaeobacter sp. QD34_3]MDE4135430.1 alpha-E domain-containing protein [Phaeobacter sp. QD34_24]MDE4175530.1 alpha-E domain-containing protein [Phaeobacter sp. PT47_59]
MLGKTANGLYWMFRYLERAENAARLIETGQRIALTRLGASDEEWRSILKTAGVAEGFDAAYETLTKDAAIDWMLRDKDNPSSVMSDIAAARQNARMVRTALTEEVWEALNGAYMRAQDLTQRKVSERDLPATLGAIRQGTALVRGATHGTMLRNDIYDFARIGTFLERADNTARILDVKYYVLLPSISAVGSAVDNVQWETILSAVSGRGGFRMEYSSVSDPRDIAQFLILDRRMPRSLSFCTRKLRANLGYLASEYGQRPPSLAKVAHLESTYLSHDIDAVFDYGLHEFIQKMLTLLADLGRQIEQDFRFYE